MSGDDPVDLPLSLKDRAEDAIALAFYRTLLEAPESLLAVKHSFYFNETYGESPSDRAFTDLVPDEGLRAEILRHLDDEVRHATLWRDYLEPRGELPADDGALPFGDFVGMLEAAGWFPTAERSATGEPLTDDELMAFFAAVHVVETQAVRQMLLFRRALKERGDDELVALLTDILRDEGRHMSYSRRGLLEVGARRGAAGQREAERLMKTAFTAFLRLRAGDMRKLLAYVRAHDWERLSTRHRAKLKALELAMRALPTLVPGPDGVALVDAAGPVPSRDDRPSPARAAA